MGMNKSNVYAWFRGTKPVARRALMMILEAVLRRAQEREQYVAELEEKLRGQEAEQERTAPRRRHLPRERDGVALRTRAQLPVVLVDTDQGREHRPGTPAPTSSWWTPTDQGTPTGAPAPRRPGDGFAKLGVAVRTSTSSPSRMPTDVSLARPPARQLQGANQGYWSAR